MTLEGGMNVVNYYDMLVGLHLFVFIFKKKFFGNFFPHQEYKMAGYSRQ